MMVKKYLDSPEHRKLSSILPDTSLKFDTAVRYAQY